MVCALLDFGDLSETYAVAEAAIALTYAMLLEMGNHERRAINGRDHDAAAPSSGLEAAYGAGRRLLVS